MIVVTGATGNVGRSLVRFLMTAGERVTAVSRGVADADVPEGVQRRPADLSDPESLRPVFDGADTLFLHNGGAGARLMNPGDVVDVAKAGGVRRVVLLSSQGVVTRPKSASHGGTGRAIEDAVRQSGLDWTILRPGGFHSNAFAWSESVRTRRTIEAPFGDVALPLIDPADIAGVAAVTLREDGHEGQIYELTGPAPVTPRQQAAAIGDALGEPVRFAEQSRAEARAQMLRFMPEPEVETTLDILGDPTPEERRVVPDTARLLNRTPTTFSTWATHHMAAFR